MSEVIVGVECSRYYQFPVIEILSVENANQWQKSESEQIPGINKHIRTRYVCKLERAVLTTIDSIPKLLNFKITPDKPKC